MGGALAGVRGGCAAAAAAAVGVVHGCASGRVSCVDVRDCAPQPGVRFPVCAGRQLLQPRPIFGSSAPGDLSSFFVGEIAKGCSLRFALLRLLRVPLREGVCTASPGASEREANDSVLPERIPKPESFPFVWTTGVVSMRNPGNDRFSQSGTLACEQALAEEAGLGRSAGDAASLGLACGAAL